MNQEFHGPVEQVAGRDIINAAEEKLWHCQTDDLIFERARCAKKLWASRIRFVINIPLLWMLGGLALMIWGLLSGRVSIVAPDWTLWGIAFGGIIFPSYWLQATRRKEAQAIAIYRERIDLIDFILQDRA
jgi:hypothetical protein